MEEAYPVNVIRRECESIDGFLVGLRAGTFLIEQYTELLQAIRTYRELVRNTEHIRRLVAIDLYYLDLALSDALTTHQNKAHYPALKKAQLECSNVIIEVFTPEDIL
jgi:hypothetical protein